MSGEKYPFGPPQHVSPFIRGARFALLTAGFFYGVSKQILYNAMERSYRQEEARKKVIRDQEIAREKQIIAQKEREDVKWIEGGMK